MTTKSITPIVNINKSQLKDDVIKRAMSMGITLKELASYEKNVEYRRKYNERPSVVAKRKAYTAKRYQKMKAIANLMKSV